MDAAPILKPILAFALGYLLGSIPFGVLLTKMGGAGDLRRIGSGNIGATNVLRTGRKGLAVATLLLDLAKGTLAVVLAAWLFPSAVQIAAIGALLGHMAPVWLRFAGGKGVATCFGIVLGFAIADGLAWSVPLAFAIGWLGMLGLTRYSSVGGLSAAAATPVAAAVAGRLDLALLFLGFSLLIAWKHRANIGRLFAGQEPKVGAAKHG